jgi:hypothetical protein
MLDRLTFIALAASSWENASFEAFLSGRPLPAMFASFNATIVRWG